MNNQWSEEARQTTRETIENQDFGVRNGKVYFKHVDRRFGVIPAGDIIAGRYVVYDPKGERIDGFESIETLLNAGWVLD